MSTEWVPVIAAPAERTGPQGPPGRTGPVGPAGGPAGPAGPPATAYIGDTPPVVGETGAVLWVDTSEDLVEIADGMQIATELRPRRLAGNGDPNGVVAAPKGSTYHRADGGAGTSLYVKESGDTGDTGWVGK